MGIKAINVPFMNDFRLNGKMSINDFNIVEQLKSSDQINIYIVSPK